MECGKTKYAIGLDDGKETAIAVHDVGQAGHDVAQLLLGSQHVEDLVLDKLLHEVALHNQRHITGAANLNITFKQYNVRSCR